jgi:tRNA nucleotidyltransferase/poly(A) polymerase
MQEPDPSEQPEATAGEPAATEHAPSRARHPEIPDHVLDPDAVKVVHRLRRTSYLAYLVGGCVRDLLLGMRPKDFDVATSAHPNQVKEVFRNSRLIGRRFRLAHVFFRGGKIIEVSTFRANPLDELEDLPQDLLIRHDNVFGTAVEDARRRDFTINGLFYDLDAGQVVDHVEGKADLKARLVRTIGDPDVRMREDPIRILRAIRFAAKCSFEVEPATLAAMKEHVEEIPRCAPPRVLEEVLKLLRSGASRRCFELLRQVGALKVLLPPVHEFLERSGPAEAERHLRALAALDAHVRVGEVPSDAVLLATLLAPLPRSPRPAGPIPKAPPRDAADAAVPAAGAPACDAAPVEAAARADEDAGDEEEGDDEAEAAPGEAESAEAEPDEDELERAARELEEEERREAAASAPLPEGALRSPDELEALHDERLGGRGIPAFSLGDEKARALTPWSLPQDVVAPEEVLTEMVRSARLPRRIAERARLILAYQPYMSGERRKRRFSPQAFVRQSFFPEALAVFELTVAATGVGADSLARWQARFAGQDVTEPPPREQHAEPGQGEPRRRRRRRGGRRRGKGGSS